VTPRTLAGALGLAALAGCLSLPAPRPVRPGEVVELDAVSVRLPAEPGWTVRHVQVWRDQFLSLAHADPSGEIDRQAEVAQSAGTPDFVAFLEGREGAGALVVKPVGAGAERPEGPRYGVLSARLDFHAEPAPSPGGVGAARSMLLALRDSGRNLADVQYINAHGTSTELNDLGETQAIKATFGPHAYKLAISSSKSIFGHLLGASGGAEAVVSALTLRDQVVHPTLNQDEKDPECDLDYVPNTARKMKVDTLLSNSFGFGGHNVTICLARFAG